MKKIKLKAESAADSDCKVIEIHQDVYNKLESWKADVFPYGCSWTTFIHHLVSDNEQRHLDGTLDRIEQLKLRDEEIYLRKSMERKSNLFQDEVAG